MCQVCCGHVLDIFLHILANLLISRTRPLVYTTGPIFGPCFVCLRSDKPKSASCPPTPVAAEAFESLLTTDEYKSQALKYQSTHEKLTFFQPFRLGNPPNPGRIIIMPWECHPPLPQINKHKMIPASDPRRKLWMAITGGGNKILWPLRGGSRRREP